MHTLLLFIITFLFGGIIWRIRGGGLKDQFGQSWTLGGTNVTRILCAAIYSAYIFLVFDHAYSLWYILPLTLAITVAWILAGWGAFQSIEIDNSYEKSPLLLIPNWLGLAPGSFWSDFIGLLQCGIIIGTFPSVVLAIVTHFYWWAAVFIPAEAIFMPCIYALVNKLQIPSFIKFIPKGTPYAEFSMGAIFLLFCWGFFW
jgi:hypothetical protein